MIELVMRNHIVIYLFVYVYNSFAWWIAIGSNMNWIELELELTINLLD